MKTYTVWLSRTTARWATAALLAVPAAGAHSAPVVVDFESLANLTSLTTQLAGFTFSNARVLRAGTTLNELSFPPKSGVNALLDDGGALGVRFDTPVLSVGAFLTYVTPITVTAYDSLDNVLATVASLYGNNEAVAGDPGSSPNERLRLSLATASIARVEFRGSATGLSFILDDLVVDAGGPSPVPEPHSLALVLGALWLARAATRPQGHAGRLR